MCEAGPEIRGAHPGMTLSCGARNLHAALLKVSPSDSMLTAFGLTSQNLPRKSRKLSMIVCACALPVKVIMPGSEWPLPWYLRSLKKIGWWTEPPADALAPVVITDANLGLALDEKTERRWLMAGLFELRPGVFLELYVELGLWKKLVVGDRVTETE